MAGSAKVDITFSALTKQTSLGGAAGFRRLLKKKAIETCRWAEFENKLAASGARSRSVCDREAADGVNLADSGNFVVVYEKRHVKMADSYRAYGIANSRV